MKELHPRFGNRDWFESTSTVVGALKLQFLYPVYFILIFPRKRNSAVTANIIINLL